MADPPPPSPGDLIVTRLRRVLDLPPDDAEVIRGLSWNLRAVPDYRSAAGGTYGMELRPGFIVSGGVIKSRHRADGVKETVGLALPGDPLGLDAVFGREMIDEVIYLPGTTLVDTDAAALRRAMTMAPSIPVALGTLLIGDLSIAEQWILCLGRFDAMQRICHLFCELSARMHAGDEPRNPVVAGLTQDQIADLVGLTPVHVNRTLHVLAKTGCITLGRGYVRLDDLSTLHSRGGFDGRYLGLR
ncbi:CRP-like cAMP-binding protein [Sphingomonas jinjuensis]|uniref:CRP-like cAMP-binding protein n=1 Tax=Sphingomonas jinjuensis TaxID=535907 RepID=A0A840FQ96_9SPHN|nr:Crp/Fnr family transcriptional regulator [Sphingomonas jinjuensis]MBB4155445.1 CRP-like cAMP-binding protein [Sphingomonas jinjuensis]